MPRTDRQVVAMARSRCGRAKPLADIVRECHDSQLVADDLEKKHPSKLPTESHPLAQ